MIGRTSSKLLCFIYYIPIDHWSRYDVSTFDASYISASFNNDGQKIITSHNSNGVECYTFNTITESFDVSFISSTIASSVSLNSTGENYAIGDSCNNTVYIYYDNNIETITVSNDASYGKIVNINSYGDIVSVISDTKLYKYAINSINNSTLTQRSTWNLVRSYDISDPTKIAISNDG